MGFSWAIIIAQLFFLEGILSIDNAAVLGAMVMPLPTDRSIPWPGWLRPLGQRIDPALGPQRQAALKVGLLGAYLGRGLMLLIANLLVRNPWIHLVGGAYLIYLGVDALAWPELPELAGEAGQSPLQPGKPGQGFWQVVLAVELADLAFSLDNVVAAVALSRHLLVVMLGVGLGILTMRFAAGLFSRLIEREPILETAAYLLVLMIGLRLWAEQLFHLDISALSQFGLSLLLVAMALLYAHWAPARALRPLIHRLRRGMRSGLQLGRQMVLRPLSAVLGLLSLPGRGS
ncbi:DUF475 domain-containing protein [Litorilinea aerophila]|nr:DUF475 domain-containing protein [Litorilinea aerophila]MCC9078417.1 DUF475 domain-containing protein [Litorilinea aerophila]